MKPLQAIALVIVSVFSTFLLMNQSFKKAYNEKITNRVYQMYGEHTDFAEDMKLYYLTGDTSQFDKYSDKYEPEMNPFKWSFVSSEWLKH